MNCSDIFQLVHLCLTDNRTAEIYCLSEGQQMEKDNPIHLHDCFEIRMLFSADETCMDKIDVTPPGICHRSLLKQDNMRAHILYVSDDFISYRHKMPVFYRYFDSPYKEQLLKCLRSLTENPDSGIIKEECRLLLSIFYLRARSKEGGTNIGEKISLFAQHLQNNYYQQDLSITDTARRFGISPGYIQRFFRTKYSLNPKEYLLKVRMEKARSLLAEGQYYIFEVASLCGFSNAHYFSDVFRHYYGFSPRESSGTDRTEP